MSTQQPPEKIDKYQILSVLGKGAMGIVYHAYDPAVKRDVAIKLLSTIGAEETELISRFEREARLAGALRHPNIVTIYDLGHYEGRPYIVMEYIVGRDLQTIIKKRLELTLEQKVEIILQICKGLDAAHQKGIIHRDIKPANIRLQEDNAVKIMDFGIARMGTSELTRSGYIIGTLQYMSPEQISGEQLDPRTDLFSTGVIAYEMFTYDNPFTGEHTVDIMYRILNVRPQPIQNIPEEHSGELNQIILRALEKNRELRYPTAKEMAQDLEEYLFYLKSLKFRRKTPTPITSIQEGVTQTIPMDQLPVASRRDQEIPPPTVAADVKNVPDLIQSVPTFGVPPPSEKAPRGGVGANYSETAQVLIKEQHSLWQEKKFYFLGALVAFVFIGALILTATVGGSRVALAVLTEPAGAEIWMDGSKIGNTPFTIRQKKDMNLELRMQGYVNRQVAITKENWPEEVNIHLEPSPKPSLQHPPEVAPSQSPESIEAPGRSIQVESTPPGAIILLDGKEIAKTPAGIQVPDDQAHQLVLQLEGYAPMQQTIDAGTPEKLALQLSPPAPEPGFVKYTGRYPVAVLSEGKSLPGNPLSLEPGVYKLTFRSSKSAYIRFTKTVEVKSGETITVRGPEMGGLTVKAVPSNCKIYLNGEFLDIAPVFNRPVQAGVHEVRFHWEALGKKKTVSVEVSPDETASVTGLPD